jgi:hypothetical protein
VRRFALAAAAGLTIGASAPERDAMRMAEAGTDLEGRTAGPPKTCIGSREAYAVESLGDSTLLFRVNRGLVYVNDARGRCPGIGRDRALVTESLTGSLCRGDRAKSVDAVSGASASTCILGDFVPYRRN